MNKRPTLKTIAEMTGLGLTTVSKALKDAPDISQKTKERVKMVASQIGYQPNRAGLRLRTGKTNVIGFVLDTEEGVAGGASELIIGMTQALESTLYSLAVIPYSHKSDPTAPVRQIIDTRSADAVILSRIEPFDRRLPYLRDAEIPFAAHGRSDMGMEHAYVDFNNTQFGMDAVRLLKQLGRRRVGLISPPLQLAYTRFLLDGYHQGINETQMKNCPMPAVTIDDDMMLIAERVTEVFSRSDHPDAMVCDSVSTTVSVIAGVEQAGLEVGVDVDIVAKQSASNFLQWLRKPIYAINEDFRHAGYELASSAVKLIDGAPVEGHQLVYYPDEWGQKVTN